MKRLIVLWLIALGCCAAPSSNQKASVDTQPQAADCLECPDAGADFERNACHYFCNNGCFNVVCSEATPVKPVKTVE